MAFFLTMAMELWELKAELRLGLATGLLGAYTTFSTFMYEGFYLYQENDKMKAVQYVVWSLLLGVIGYMIGAEVMQL